MYNKCITIQMYNMFIEINMILYGVMLYIR